jgi:predicted O-methyltransferase YrrM
MWVFYDGKGKTGTISVNSKADPGFKYRVKPYTPLLLKENDEWMKSLPGFHVLMIDCYEAPLYFLPEIEDESYLPFPQAAWLLGLCAHLPGPAYVVEIGTGKGCSLLNIACGLSMHEDAHIWSIDLMDKSLDIPEKLAETGIPAGRYDLLFGDSVEIGAGWKVPLDLVYFDGNHSDIGVSRDITSWTPHICRGGIAVFDDYGNPMHGVSGAVDRLMKSPWTKLGQIGTMIAFRKGI